MITYIRWLLPAGCLALGLYLLALSYETYARWQEHLALGDTSGAEFYEVTFRPEVTVGLLLVLLGAFLAGRWSRRSRP